MTKAGRTNAKINTSKYLSNSDVANVDVEVDDVNAAKEACQYMLLWVYVPSFFLLFFH
jgi:hypothetical protein